VSQWKWIGTDIVLAIHDELLVAYGGADGIRDRGGLESALARPLNLTVYTTPDIADLAAIYAVGISQAQAFIEGNKRTAWTVARTFLRLNGYDLECGKVEAIIVMMCIAKNEIGATEFAKWLRPRLRVAPPKKPT
jgi:death on curing protein